MHIEPDVKSLPSKQVEDLPIFDPKAWNYGTERRLNREPLTFHLEPYRRLGPIYRVNYLGQEHVVIAGPEANEFVWRNADLWCYSERMEVFREGYDDTCILQLDGSKHQKKRRRFVQGFKPTCLASLGPKMYNSLTKEIENVSSSSVDLRSLCKRLTTGMTSQALLQMNLPQNLDKQIDDFSHDLLSGQRLGFLRHLWYLRPSYRRVRNQLFFCINQMLDEREAHPPMQDDILSLMIQAHPSDEPPLTRQEIVLDVLFLLQAGTETASNIILWTLMYLYHRPEWLAEIREELRTWTPQTFKSLNDWPKMKATILESERLYPPVPFFVLIPNRDFEYQGHQIRKGTRIFYASALTHVLPEIYEDPSDFRPERFLGKKEYPAKANATFGSGAHACLGQSLANIKIFLTLAHIVNNYDLVFEQKPSFHLILGIVITPVEATLPVRFVPRRNTTTTA